MSCGAAKKRIGKNPSGRSSCPPGWMDEAGLTGRASARSLSGGLALGRGQRCRPTNVGPGCDSSNARRCPTSRLGGITMVPSSRLHSAGSGPRLARTSLQIHAPSPPGRQQASARAPGFQPRFSAISGGPCAARNPRASRWTD